MCPLRAVPVPHLDYDNSEQGSDGAAAGLHRGMMIQAILFDSDGVLVDTERLYFDATREAFATAGATVTARQWAHWYLGESHPSRVIAERVGIPADRITATLGQRDALFWSRVDQGVPILSGVVSLLTQLSPHYRLAVVTGAGRAHYERVHAATGLPRFFEAAITRDDYAEPKPRPDAYYTALERLGLTPDQCVAVEDSPRGAAAATAAGLRCLVIPTPLTATDLCPPACRIVPDLSALAGLLQIDERPRA
jgi:HAD superfamily hydrolase (TIGR01509 family)